MTQPTPGLDAQACAALLVRCKQLKLQQAWQPLRQEASAALQCATALGRDADRALAAHLLANAHRALGDTPAAVNAYRISIEAAASVGDRKLLAVGQDNLANALRDSGRLDEAMDQYEQALESEDDARGRSIIRLNLSQAKVLLGDLRSALKDIHQHIGELEAAKVSGRELAIALGQAAMTEVELGAEQEALGLLARAREQMPADDLEGQAANALQHAAAYRALEDRPAAAQAFSDAYQRASALARARLAPPRDTLYRQGFERACESRLPFDRALALLTPGVQAKGVDAWVAAEQHLAQAHREAREVGDHALALRLAANGAAALADAGQIDPARQLLEQVRHEASQRGLALPEAMANGTLGSILVRSGELYESLGALGLYTRAAALADLHRDIVLASGLPPQEAGLELVTQRAASLDTELALLAEAYCADALAAQWFDRGVAAVRTLPPSFELVNRLSGLLGASQRMGSAERARSVAAEITALLATNALPERAQLVAHRALARYVEKTDTASAAQHMRAACDNAERLRAHLPQGPGRAEINRDFSRLHHELARPLRRQGDDRGAFEALQGDKGRRLIDALALRSGTTDNVPTLVQVQHLLQPSDVLVDFELDKDELSAYLVGAHSLQVVSIQGDTKALVRAEVGDVMEREAALVKLCQNNAQLAGMAAAISAALPANSRLIVAPDAELHNLPLHIIPVDGRPWCERFPMGYIPAAGALRLLVNSTARGALVAGDSALNLPFAAAECRDVASQLRTLATVGAACTRAAIESRLRDANLDIIHLALHGRADPWRGGRASLLMSDGAGGTEWVAFDDLAALHWRANLVVFSGCSTGVSGPRSGHELASVARAALEAGAASVLACLWPVGDAAAATFMKAFHTALVRERARGPVDLRVILDEARAALRQTLRSAAADPAASRRRDGQRSQVPAAMAGNDDALAWAPFVLLGNPWLA